MADPVERDPKIEELLGRISGKNRKETIRKNECVTCDGDATEFTDERSEREYAITGMCQKCQDETFKESEE